MRKFILLFISAILLLGSKGAVAQCAYLQSDIPADIGFSRPTCVGTGTADEHHEDLVCNPTNIPYTKYYIVDPFVLWGFPSFKILNEDTQVEVPSSEVEWTRIDASGNPVSTGSRIKVVYNRLGNFRIRASWGGTYEIRDMVVKIAQPGTSSTVDPSRFEPFYTAKCPSPYTGLTIVRTNSTNPITRYTVDIRAWNTTTDLPITTQPLFSTGVVSGNVGQITPNVPSNFFVAGFTYKIFLTVRTQCLTTDPVTPVDIISYNYLTIQGAPTGNILINNSATPAAIKDCGLITLTNNNTALTCGTTAASGKLEIKDAQGTVIATKNNIATTGGTYDLKTLFTPAPAFVNTSGTYVAVVTMTNGYGTNTASCIFTTDYSVQSSATFGGSLQAACGIVTITPTNTAASLPTCGTNYINIRVDNGTGTATYLPLKSGTGTVYTIPYPATNAPINVNNLFPIDRGAGGITYGVEYYITNSLYPNSGDAGRSTLAYYANYASALPTTNFKINNSSAPTNLYDCEAMTLTNTYTHVICEAITTATLSMQRVNSSIIAPIVNITATAGSYNLKTLFPQQTTTQGTYDITLRITNQFGTSTTTKRVLLAIQLNSNANFNLLQYRIGSTNASIPRQTVFSNTNIAELGGRSAQINLTSNPDFTNPGAIDKYKVEVWEVNNFGTNKTIPPLLNTAGFGTDGFITGMLPDVQLLNYLYDAQNNDDYFNLLSETDRANKRFKVVFTGNNRCGDVSAYSFFKIRENCANCRTINPTATETEDVALNTDDKILAAFTYPNPATNEVTITYNLPTETRVRLSVCDALGKIMATPTLNSNQTAGSQTYTLDIANFAIGMYFYTLQTDTGKVNGKFIKQ